MKIYEERQKEALKNGKICAASCALASGIDSPSGKGKQKSHKKDVAIPQMWNKVPKSCFRRRILNGRSMQEVPISQEVKQRLEAYCRSTGQVFEVVLQEAVQLFLRDGGSSPSQKSTDRME